ncbi:MAG: NADH-quinone oxidoreductase subunit NuoG, partial [Acidimicrobiales bacterium]
MTIDGREVKARKGQWIIDAADAVGVFIPRFCYHPRLKPVGMCRMCLVEVSSPRGFSLQPACYNTVADGLEIRTTSPAAKKAQDGVLEFLLVNHPLDCPVCDKGGECPLQDQTLAYGPGESRFVEEKRHWDKPIPISPLVYLDRERCIQCGRCVRFADEVAGDPLIDFAHRGDLTEVAAFPDAPFSSYFSGNIVQICPVGALTAHAYRFKARPWDLHQVESTCTGCAVGCRVTVQCSSDRITRLGGVDSDPVNWAWLCDKGRFGYAGWESPQRVIRPLVRKKGELVEVGWDEALAAAAAGIRNALDLRGAGSVAVIGGARLANEDAYAWSKAARVALRTDHVDSQLGDGVPADLVLGLSRVTIDEAVAAPLVITVCGDLKEELPILYLRLRQASRDNGLQILELAPGTTGLSPYAALTLRYRPGDLPALARALAAPTAPDGPVGSVPAGDIAQARAHLRRAMLKGQPGSPSAVVLLGRPSLAEPTAAVAEAAQTLATLPEVAFLPALRRSNVHGALDMGLAPGILPGRVGLDAGRAWFEHHWGASLPAASGLDTAGILDTAAGGRLGALILLGADPRTDFPDQVKAAAGLDGASFVVSVDAFLNASSERADVVLPAAGYAERRGTFTNVEGRVTWLGQAVTSPGLCWPDWMIASELATRLGVDLGFTDIESIWDEIARVSPLHRQAKYAWLGGPSGRDGFVAGTALGAPAELHPLDPMADPGYFAVEPRPVSPGSWLARAAANGAAPKGAAPKGAAPNSSDGDA